MSIKSPKPTPTRTDFSSTAAAAQLSSPFGQNMHILMLKIIIVITGIWASIRPAVYGVLSLFFGDLNAVVDLIVLSSCIILVMDMFKALSFFLWSLSLAILLIAANIGFFYYFRDFGESGPLPYEWLNGYYKFALPLIALSFLNRCIKWKFEETQKNNEQNK